MENLFNIDGPLMRAMRDLTSLVLLNLLTLLFSLPLVSAGAALSALHYVLWQMIEEEDGHIVAAWWEQFQGNLRTVTPAWVILLVPGAALALLYGMVRGGGSGVRAELIPIYAGSLVLLLLLVWLLPLEAKFVYGVGGALHNALYLALHHPGRTLVMAAVMVVIPYLLLQVTALLPLAFLLGLSFPSYLCALICHPVLEQMVKAQEKKRG